MQKPASPSPASPMHLVIVGGGTAGWMAANLLVKKWADQPIDITLVESPDIGTVGVGEGSTPSLKRFFEIIDVPESLWMHKCNATYKLSIRFSGWSPASGIDSYGHPFTTQVDTFYQRAFQVNCLTRRLGLDVNTQPENFFLNGVLAQEKLGPQAPPSFPFEMPYGYHFDAGLLGNFLAETAKDRGVEHLQTKITDVNRNESGEIESLSTDTGQIINGDFFIDCTGFASVLMQKTLGTQFQSFGENLFNDSAVVTQTPQINQDITPETLSTAMSSGWCWRIPLTNRVGNGYVFSSGHLEPEKAEQEFRRHLNIDDQQECRHLKMRVGQLEKHWSHNCIGLGLSQGFIEPLEATALHLVQITTELFISLYEEGGFSNDKRDEFNQRIHKRFEAVRDYIVAHYKLNTRDDIGSSSNYWRENRENMALSDSLLSILDTWYRQKDLAAELDRQKLENHFSTASWHCLLSGYGTYPPLADNQPGQGDLYVDQKIREALAGCALNFRPHRENLLSTNIRNSN